MATLGSRCASIALHNRDQLAKNHSEPWLSSDDTRSLGIKSSDTGRGGVCFPIIGELGSADMDFRECDFTTIITLGMEYVDIAGNIQKLRQEQTLGRDVPCRAVPGSGGSVPCQYFRAVPL